MKKSTLIIIGVLVLILTDLIYGSYKFKQAKNLTSNSNDKTTSEAKETEPQKENESPNTLVFVGDIMLSRTVGTKILKTGDVNSPFLKTASVTQNADVAFANLESPFLDTGARMTAGMVFKAEPDTVAGLVYAGFDIVSLANNHFGNQGQKGMAYTFSLLKKNNINYVGAGENSTRAAEPKIIEKNGLKFAFLGYDDVNSTITPQSYVAQSARAGLNPLSELKIAQDVIEAKKTADLVIVSLHWGTEYKTAPNNNQIKIAHVAIDNGASIVIGHHPHVVQYFNGQPYEKYKDGYVFYSLGNFVFDQMWSENTKKGLIARISLKGKNIEKVEGIPITIYDYFQPKID